MMKRFLLLGMILAMTLCLFAGCKSADQEESALIGDMVGGSAQDSAGGESNGPQKVENSKEPSSDAGKENINGGVDNSDTPDNNAKPDDNAKPDNNAKPDDNVKPDDNAKPDDNGSVDDENEGNEEDPYAAMKADTSGTKIKIMCQNLRLNANADQGTDNDARLRRYRFQTLVEKYDPDIIACQEADPYWLDVLAQDYGAKYGLFYKQRGIIPGTSSSDEACPVLWKLDKYTKIDEGYFWLSRTPNQCSVSYEEGQLPRIINWVALKDKATGSKFYIYSAHYGFYKEDSSIAGIRDQVIGALAKIPKDAYGFVMGDYNFVYQNDQYYVYTDGVNIVDLRPTAEEMAANGHCTLGDIRNGAYNAFTEDDGGAFGDFIMAAPRKKMAIDTFGYLYDKPGNDISGTPAGFVSDHFAVYTEVRIDTDISYEEYFGSKAK